MKYWWLEKYQDFKIIQITELASDIDYFLTMPNNYEKKYLVLKDKKIEDLEEEELLIILKRIVDTKNIKDNSLSKIIDKLVQIPDNSFPATDYSINDIIQEIKQLKENYPIYEKMNNSNIAACYNCLNVFYVDKIKSVNKKNVCLCPFCLSTKLYFDSDYIPMNYLFIRLAYLYYNRSKLGCTFKEMKKILKRDIIIENKLSKYDFDFTSLLTSNKLKAIDEKILSKEIYDLLIEKENNFNHEVIINIDNVKGDISSKLLMVIIVVVYTLSNAFSLNKVLINIKDKNVYNETKHLVRRLLEF